MNIVITQRYQTFGQGWFSSGYAYEVRDTLTNAVVANRLSMEEAFKAAKELNSKATA